jgi:cell shape-determining protein MreD
MKTTYNVFTVLMWIAIIYAAFNFVLTLSNRGIPNDSAMAIGTILGALLASLIIPGIFWLIRYFIGKEVKK